MINIGKILKRAWHNLWNYRVLWIFGILLCITGGSRGGNGGSGNSGYQFKGNGYQGVTTSTNPIVQELNLWFQQNIEPLVQYPAQHIATFVWIGVGLLLFILIVGVIFALIRYPAETAVIRMVDEYERTGAKSGFKQGWKTGWNRRAFRLWVIDLIVSLPAILFVAILGCLGLLVYFSVRNGSQAAIATGVIAGIGCAFLLIFAFVILMVLLSLLRQFFMRAAALENAGIGASFRFGWAMFKRNWKSAALMWVVMLGIGIGVAIAGLIVFFLLIPVYLVLILPAAIVAVIPGLAVFGITSIFATGPLAWILGILAALPFFFLIVFAPLCLLGGWYIIYESNVWTLTYREMKALEKVAPAEVQVSSG
ncbi:MAG: hypothetical protein ABSF99_03105 [Anaerolineales bacterium]|jgi:hypothetical protein